MVVATAFFGFGHPQTPFRVLVTGAGGFIGRAVTERLVADGHEVTSLVHRSGSRVAERTGRATTVAADLTDRGQVGAVVPPEGFDAVCHLAAATRVCDSIEDPLHAFEVNVGGTLNLLRALHDRDHATGSWTRFVLGSTAAVYGSVNTDAPLREDRLPASASPLAASKLAAEQLVAAQAATGALGGVTLRCFNVAGAVDSHGDRDLSRVIPKAIAVAAGEAAYFGLNGDGPIVHVIDVAEAFSRAVDAAAQGEALTVNIGSGRGVTMRDVLQAVERVTGRPVPVRINPPKPEPSYLVADIDLARRRLNWALSPHSELTAIVRDAWHAIEPAHREVG